MSKSHKMTHAYIITGSDEVARRTRAEVLAGEILALAGQAVVPSTFTYVVPEKSISRERIAGVLHDLSMTAFGGDYRIIVIEGAEQLTPEAGNALLKSLEEPSDNVVFMLLAPTVARLMPTLRSRAQMVTAGATVSSLDDEKTTAAKYFFTQGIPERFAQIAQLADRGEQLALAEGLLHHSQQHKNYSFAAWLQEKFVKTQKSGNIRLLLEASAILAGSESRV